MSKNGIMLLLLGLVTNAVSAQNYSKPVLPPGPMVAQIPRPGTWSVTYTYPQEEAQSPTAVPSPYTRNLKMENAGAVTHVIITEVGGVADNLWKSGTEAYVQYGERAAWLDIGSNDIGSQSQKADLNATTFPGLDWLQATYFIGQVRYHDTDCLLFMMGDTDGINIDDATALNEKIKHASNMALIEVQSRHPIEVHSGGVKEVFQYGHPPAMLAFPADLKLQIAQGHPDPASERAPRPF